MLPPFVAQALGSTVGSYTMFNRLERYRLELKASTVDGDVDVPVHSLGPHLSREAKIILLPAAGFAIGADQVEVVREGLHDLAAFVCDLEPRARSGRAVLVREPMHGVRRSLRHEVVADCRRSR